MPDTGAPWNIPYVAGTDLVSDWPTDSQDLATAIADGLDAAQNAGIGSNVVQTVKTDGFSTTSTSFTDITGFTLSFTPTTSSSKVLLIATFGLIDANAGIGAYFDFQRDGTSIGVGGSGIQTSIAQIVAGNDNGQSAAWSYLDSPATTSAVTYKGRMRVTGNTGYVNRDAAASRTAIATLTAIEVAA